MNHRVDRRTFAAMTGVASALAANGAMARTLSGTPSPVATGGDLPPLDVLRIRHPDTLAFAAPFLMMQSGGALSEFAKSLDVDTWPTPDVLRSFLVNGQSDVTAVPTYVGANLSNRGVDVRMAAVVVWGLLSVIGPEDAEPDWESLREQTVMVPFPNDMPDLVFRYLAMNNGMTPGEDFEIQYFAQPPEIVARLVSGQGTWAVAREHTTTLAIARAREEGHALDRVLDLQEEWGAVTGSEPRIPQAGIVVPGSLAEERPELLGAILEEMGRAVDVVNAAEPDTVATLADASGVPQPVVEEVIPRLNLEIVPGEEARDELERFFTELLTLSEDIVGGRLPDDAFYVPDPR